MILGSPADWIAPKLALFSDATGALKLTRLSTLKTSHRNCTHWDTPNLNGRVSAKSFCRFDGFMMVNGASVLYVPVVGDVNAARFRYAVGSLPVTYGLS